MKAKLKLEPEGLYAVRDRRDITVKLFRGRDGLHEARELVSKRRSWYITPMPADYQNSEQFVYPV